MKYELNEEQWEAVISPSPVLVHASAGSGKTRCLISKIMYLLDSGLSNPDQICAITFTNKAADEMKDRLRKKYDIGKMQVSTIHSMCVRIIKSFTHHTFLKTPFTIYDDGNQLSIIKTILKSRSLSDNPYEVLSDISRIKSGISTIKNSIEEIYNQYQEILKANNACDFDDLLVYALECLKHDDCRNHFSNLWRHILVDEFQDTSIVQFDIITKLYNPSFTKTLFIVADANQSIYGWRAARPKNIEDFTNKFSPSVKYLTYNYRSCSQLINFANGYLQYGKPMVSKSNNQGQVSLTKFDSYENEAERISQALLAMRGYEETAILYRMNSRSLLFEQAFTRHRIPYKIIGDRPFYQRRVVRDLLSYLRSATNKHDIESLNRIVNVPRRGFGDAKKEKLLIEGRNYIERVALEMPEIESFLNLLDSIKNKSPFDALNEILYITGYRNDLTKESDTFMVDALLDVSKSFDTLEDLILASTFIEKDSGNGVKLMTAHASKGLEFDRIFVVGVEEGIWPHKLSEDVKEEERLFYVACTRAKRYLNISYSASRNYRGQPMQMFPSSLFRRSYRSVFGKDMKDLS